MKHNVAGPIADLAGAADELLPPRAARALFWRPRLLQNAAWTIHVPFAFWLVETCRPRRIVELGLGKGVSYFAFCQAVDKLGIEARCTGIDHWEGDRFSRADPDAGATPQRHNEQFYQDFSDLVSADLIGAEARFPDETVDLLHVDVALTPPVIDSLLHDWPRKLSRRAVVALHGTRTRCETPEAADFLARIRARHRTFEIEDGEGLTLALIGTEQPERLARLAALEPGSPEAGAARLIFRQLGRGHEFEAASRRDGARLEALRGDLARAEAEQAALRAELATHRAALTLQTRSAAEAQARLFDLNSAQAEASAATLAERADLAAALEAARDEIARLAAAAEAAGARAEAAEALCAAQETDLGAGRAATETARADLAAARDEIARLTAAAEAALGGGDGAAVEAERAVFEAGLREARETLIGARRRIAELETEAAAAAKSLAARFAELAKLGAIAELARARSSVEASTKPSAEPSAELATARRGQLEAERAAIAAEAARRRTEDARAADRAEMKRLKAAFDRAVALGGELEARHAALLGSGGWRALEPARRLGRLVGRGAPPADFAPQFAALAAEATPPAQPGADRAAPEAAERIDDAFEKAREVFPAAGRAELAALRPRRSTGDAGRRQIARALILLDAEAAEPETRANALAALEATPVWRADPDGPGEAAALRLALLAGTGRGAEAAALAAAPPPEAARNPDFLLLAAGLVPPGPDADAARLTTIAKAFWRAGKLPVVRDDAAAPLSLDNLGGGRSLKTSAKAMKISVIVPAYNCADTLRASLRSLTQQTWSSLEILVVDDASADATADVAAELAEADPRIRLIRLETNGGAYAARNAGLAAATGELVTCQDADDWSHPDRLRRQAEHLRAHPYLIANASHWARATPDLRFERRPFTARVIHFNSSSVMFRRARVLERVGFWDSVRFGADTEFWRRLQAVFGPDAVAELPELLAIGRIREGSLTRAPGSAYAGVKTGARRAYELAWRNWHATAAPEALRLPFPLAARPFGAPAILATGRPRTGHFDAVLISDFRHLGGTTASNLQELIAQTRAGVKTALVQVDRYDFDVSRGIHPEILALIDDGAVEQLVEGDDVTADVAVVRFPPIFSHRQDFLPRIRPRAVRVVVNQPPRRVAGEPPFWSIATCKANIAAYLGQEGDWVPIGPAVRDALAADGEADALTAEDWFNIIDVDAWRVERRGWAGKVPVIGRHGRDAAEKWLTRKAELIAAYPIDGSVRVRVMGGADIALRTIGKRPEAWEVLGFNALPVKDFLAGIDFFVFFPHEGRIEAFGRTVIEAMASGALAILPPAFAPLFGEAAVYCAPAEVGPTVARFYADRAAYLAQTDRAEAIVRDRFGFERHVARLRAAQAADSVADPAAPD